MIPYWRYVSYSDDGCAIYECLNCYQGWEARTDPKWSSWTFCPYCGCKWEGQKEWDESAKWDRKKGTPIPEGSRLMLPLFMVQSRMVPLDSNDPDDAEWENVSNYPRSIFDAVFDLEYASNQEACNDLMFFSREFRIIYNPNGGDPFYQRTKKNTLQWREVDFSVMMQKWNRYKENLKKISQMVTTFQKTA